MGRLCERKREWNGKIILSFISSLLTWLSYQSPDQVNIHWTVNQSTSLFVNFIYFMIFFVSGWSSFTFIFMLCHDHNNNSFFIIIYYYYFCRLSYYWGSCQLPFLPTVAMVMIAVWTRQTDVVQKSSWCSDAPCWLSGAQKSHF